MAFFVMIMFGFRMSLEEAHFLKLENIIPVRILFIFQGNKCHLVAAEVVALDPSYSMKTMWGVKSYAMVEESAFVEQSPPVPSMDQYSLMAGGSQSLTTFAAGGDAWQGIHLNMQRSIATYFVSSP